MSNYVEFEAIFENDDEFSKKRAVIPIHVDLDRVEQWFQDIDDDYNIDEENTVVVFHSGAVKSLKVNYQDFTQKMWQRDNDDR